MKKYLILCFNHARDSVTKYETTLEKEAEKIYDDEKKSGSCSSVTLRVEERAYGYAIKSWSEEDGEVYLNHFR